MTIAAYPTVDATADPIAFGPFRLESSNARLLRDDRPVALTPKAFDVLQFLASRPDRLVSKDELLSAVWPDVLVSDASVKVCVREIRKALADDADAPRYIQTVHRRGYRFIAPIQEEEAETAPVEALAASARRSTLIGRDLELAALREHFARAVEGSRQCVFVTGGPGSGKTALIEAFVREAEAHAATAGDPARVLIGHCFEQFGTSEPYMPVWEALGRLAAAHASSPPPTIAALLEEHVTAKLAVTTTIPVSQAAPRGMSERLLRGITDGIEALAAGAPVVLVLEDLHWADYSTLDLVSALARRRQGSARLLVIATYRPADVSTGEHPLRAIAQSLLASGICSELPLRSLDEDAVAQYLSHRFSGATFPSLLSQRLHQRTDGHPLFLVHLVDDLIEQGVLVRDAGGWTLAGESPDPDEVCAWQAVLDTQVPQTVRAMIELQLERLDERERRLIEAAAVAGVEASAAAVAAALADEDAMARAGDVVVTEKGCDAIAQRHRFLESRGVSEWPDGTTATHYRFAHELYHNVVYERVPAARRARMHRALGLRLESAWGARAPEEAATLAMHFEAGRDWPRAIGHLRQAALAAGRHYAHREAVRYLRRALALIDRVSPEVRGEHELPILMSLGVNLQVTDGFAATEFRDVYTRALAICQPAAADATRDLPGVHSAFPVLWGIWMFHKVRSELRQAEQMTELMRAMAEESNDAALIVQAHQSMCVTQFCLGNLKLAVEHMQRVEEIYDPVAHAGNAEVFGQDPLVTTLSFGSLAMWLMGRTDESVAANAKLTARADELGRPSTLALASYFSAMLHQFRGDAAATRAAAERTISLAADEGFTFWLAGATILRGWAAAVTGEVGWGIAEIRRGQSAWAQMGSKTYCTYHLGLLADVLLRIREPREAIGVLDEALLVAGELPEGFYEAELHRLKGEATTALKKTDEANRAFTTAREIAARQGAQWVERRCPGV